MAHGTSPRHWRAASAYEDRTCVYCGLPGENEDHLLPRAWTGDARRSEVQRVFSCSECNSTLSDTYLPTVSQRRDYVKDRLRRKYAKLLATPSWTESELAEVDGELKMFILAQEARRRVIRARLAWPVVSSEARAAYRQAFDEALREMGRD